jgi:hypothetical protein
MVPNGELLWTPLWILRFHKKREYLDELNNCHFLKLGSVLWSCIIGVVNFVSRWILGALRIVSKGGPLCFRTSTNG